MKDEDKKFIQETLNTSKGLTKSVNIFMKQNNLNINSPKKETNPKNNNNNNKKGNKIISKNKNPQNGQKMDKVDEESDEEEEENDMDNQDDDIEDGIFTYEYVTKNVDRYQQKVAKYDELVKKNLALSKSHPNKKDEYKEEAIRALKKKKFYSKALERYENRKLKMDLKILNKEYNIQKKEIKKLTRDLKRKVRLVTMGRDVDEEFDVDDSGSDDEDNDKIFDQIDLNDNDLNVQYENIINGSDVQQAAGNFNLFKYIFQEE